MNYGPNFLTPMLYAHIFRLDTSQALPQGFWGSGKNGYLFSGSWGALVIIFMDLGSKLIVLGIKVALPKSKK